MRTWRQLAEWHLQRFDFIVSFLQFVKVSNVFISQCSNMFKWHEFLHATFLSFETQCRLCSEWHEHMVNLGLHTARKYAVHIKEANRSRLTVQVVSFVVLRWFSRSTKQTLFTAYQAERRLPSSDRTTTVESPACIDGDQTSSEFLRVHAKINQAKSASWP